MDLKEIFSKIDKEHQLLSYEQNVELLNDLAYVVMPFDKTHREFQLLIANLKLQLQSHTGNVKFFALVDAVNRLGIDSFRDLIRAKLEEGNYSRAP